MHRIAGFILVFGLLSVNTFSLSAHSNHLGSIIRSDTAFKYLDKNNASTDIEGTSLNFESSNLPVLVIQTNNNQAIPDGSKITAHLGIIYNGPGLRNYLTDPFNHYNGAIGIELRGNSSQSFPKKPYNFETRDNLGVNLNVSILGMPEENDWCLIASYLDHSFARNLLASHMSRQTGNWASRGQLVEVVLNGEYRGIYILMEKIKPDKGRLDIAKLTPDEIYSPDITGGYIFEITGFENTLDKSRNLKYPDFYEAAAQQITYIKQYDDNFRSVMSSANYKDTTTGYAAWIDVDSFVDELMVQEAMRNSDAYGWSGYFHKDKNGKLRAGPVWDFDQSAGNSSYPDNGVSTGWMFSHSGTSNTPFFWKLLYADPAFSYKVKLHWEALRAGAYRTDILMAYIDSIANVLSEAQAREFTQWTVLGQDIWRETYGYQQRNTYQKEVNYLKTFLTQRWAWMDNELAKITNPVTTSVSTSGSADDKIQVYPNPAKEQLVFIMNAGKPCNAIILIYDLSGKLLINSEPYDVNTGSNRLVLKLDVTMQPGVYFYKIYLNNEPKHFGKFIKVDL